MASTSLQWSHVFSNVEIRFSKSHKSMKKGASMEPRFFKRGNRGRRGRGSGVCGCFNGATFFQTWKCFLCGSRPFNGSASMEPRFFKRGNTAPHKAAEIALRRFNGATFFQTWKSFWRCKHFIRIEMLQWSHVFSNVEISRQAARCS